PAAPARPQVPAGPAAPARPQVPAGPDSKWVFSGQAMGTVVQLTFWHDDEAAAASAAQAVFEEMKRLDRMMTTWLPDSEVSQINSAAGATAIKVSPETFAVIERALEISRRSGGVFDITVGSFRGLWKFDEDMDGTLPASAEVLARRKLVAWRDVVLDKKQRTVKLRRKGMSITLGGIAKGYAVDRCVELLHQAGFADFIFQAGGDLYVSGKKDTQPWVVGIRDPRGARDAMFALAPIEDHAFSTSGDYERGFVKDGVRYHHILDPRTAFPAKASRSVTVMAKDAFTADAWSKVLFILGWKRAMPIVEQLGDFEAVFVDPDNNVHVSSGLRGRLKILRPPTPGV
ncbi:MAG TPA: FAD:protein FMN transferase, partial [Kofleriaceae bacterium]|nr:FAD:protein FMN transferase [Kofleriaceae bacterium]